MDDVRIGIRFRALRLRLGWRQHDLAEESKVSQGVVSLVERGRIEEVTIRKLRRIARELDAEFASQVRWRGGDLDRLVDEGHAMLVGRTITLLRDAGWDARAEVSFSVYGERGSIDVLGWHAPTRSLVVVEVKTALVSVEETVRKHDQKARLAARIAAESFGWRPARVSRLLVLPDQSTTRRRVTRHEAVMTAAYPVRSSAVRGWLKSPTGFVSGLVFVTPPEQPWPAGRGVARRRVTLARADRGTISR